LTLENIISPNFKRDSNECMRDHVWVLFVLADISKYFEERNLPQVAAVLEETIFSVESEILSQPCKTKTSETVTPLRCVSADSCENLQF